MGEEAGSNLEMRCTVDEAWYDGTLRRRKDLVIVHFNDFDEEEDETFPRSELTDPAKLRSRVRVRSMQLQDCQCKTVYVGQRICGCLDDGEDRKYYDAEVVQITPQNHSFKEDGDQECLCKFTLLWLAGPEKSNHTKVGCADVCFLSTEMPEDDPMVKNLMKASSTNGEQRQKLVKITKPSPRIVSPSLELVVSKKQPSKELSLTLPSHRVNVEPRSSPQPVGSKKKRIMQAEEELTDVASDNDVVSNLELDAWRISMPNNSHHQSEVRYGNVSDGDEQRSEGKRGHVQGGKRRLVKGQVKARTIETVAREEAVRVGVIRDIPQSFRERVKFNTIKKAIPEVVVGHDSSQLLEEQVKLKTTKNNLARQVEARNNSLEKVGEQVVKQMWMKGKQSRLEDQPSHQDGEHISETDIAVAKAINIVAEAVNVVMEPKQQVKRKPGRPRKHPLPKAKIVLDNLVTKTQRVIGLNNEQRQSPPEKEIRDSNVETLPSSPVHQDRMTKKRPRIESSLPDVEGIKSTQGEEVLEVHMRKRAFGTAIKEKKKRNLNHEGSRHEEIVSNKTAQLHMVVNHDDHHSLHAKRVDATIDWSCQMANQSLAERCRNIENKFGNHQQVDGSAELLASPIVDEVITLEDVACHGNQTEEELEVGVNTLCDMRVSSLGGEECTKFSGEVGTSEKRCRRQVVITDDEMDDVVQKKLSRNHCGKDLHGSDVVDSSLAGQDECNIDATPHTIREDIVLGTQIQIEQSRLLLIENMEMDVSAQDAMQLLMDNTKGVCAVHVLPASEFQVNVSGYALYRDHSSTLQALQWLTSVDRFVVSPNGRPWKVSLATDMYGPRMCGFATHSAYKSDDPVNVVLYPINLTFMICMW